MADTNQQAREGANWVPIEESSRHVDGAIARKMPGPQTVFSVARYRTLCLEIGRRSYVNPAATQRFVGEQTGFLCLAQVGQRIWQQEGGGPIGIR
jgi:hypothetical protein